MDGITQSSKSELIIFGSYWPWSEWQRQAVFKSYKYSTISIFSKYGYLGVSNLIFGIIRLKHIKNGIKSIDVIDRDVYGRESLITIELC